MSHGVWSLLIYLFEAPLCSNSTCKKGTAFGRREVWVCWVCFGKRRCWSSGNPRDLHFCVVFRSWDLQLGCLELPIATMLPPFLRLFKFIFQRDGKISRLHIIIVYVVEVVVVVLVVVVAVVVVVVVVVFFVVVAVLKVPSRALYEMKQN